MYYGKGRLWGNTGTYVVELVPSNSAWEAEDLLRKATALKEQAQLPKLAKASPNTEEAIYDSLESKDDPTRRNKVYNLGYGVYFFEFVDPSDFEGSPD